MPLTPGLYSDIQQHIGQCEKAQRLDKERLEAGGYQQAVAGGTQHEQQQQQQRGDSDPSGSAAASSVDVGAGTEQVPAGLCLSGFF